MIRIFQIYFKPDQLPCLEKEYIPFFNQDCTPFFENSVIRELVISQNQTEGCDYFGVVSHKLRKKLDVTKKWKNVRIANTSLNEFSPCLFERELLTHNPDAFSFQRHVPHDPVTVATNFHPEFSKHFSYILKSAGYDWKPKPLKNVFYCNYFVAKSEVYKKYVSEMLVPCMDVMESMPELWKDSRYPERLPEELKIKWGVDHYPYHTFLCERMFSYFAEIHKLNCLSY